MDARRDLDFRRERSMRNAVNLNVRAKDIATEEDLAGRNFRRGDSRRLGFLEKLFRYFGDSTMQKILKQD